jgi:hypothetical protein
MGTQILLCLQSEKECLERYKYGVKLGLELGIRLKLLQQLTTVPWLSMLVFRTGGLVARCKLPPFSAGCVISAILRTNLLNSYSLSSKRWLETFRISGMLSNTQAA